MVGRTKLFPALLHFQLRQRTAHAHFPGAVVEQDYQAAVVLSGAVAGVGLVLGAQIQAREEQSRPGLPPGEVVTASHAAQQRERSHVDSGGTEASLDRKSTR